MFKKIGLGVLGIFACAFIGVHFIDWSQYKEPLLAQIHEKTGYTVHVDGGIHLSFLPLPTLKVENVTVQAPAQQQPLLSLSQALLKLDVRPLLSGKISIHTVDLKAPRVVLSAFKDQKEMAGSLPAGLAEKNVSTEKTPQLSIQHVRITDGTVVIAQGKEETTLENIQVDAAVDSLQGPFRGSAAVTYKTYTIAATGECGVLTDMTPSAVALKTSIKQKEEAFGSFEVKGEQQNGLFKAHVTAHDLKLPVQFSIADKRVDLSKGLSGEFDVGLKKESATIEGLKLTLQDLTLLGNGAYQNDAATGQVILTVGKSQLQLALNATTKAPYGANVLLTGQALKDFYGWLNLVHLSATLGESIQVKAAASYDNDVLSVKNIQLDLGTYKGQGNLTVDQRGKTPIITADVNVPVLELTQTKPEATAQAPVTPTSAVSAATSDRFDKTPFTFPTLPDLDAKLSLTIGTFRSGPYILTNVAVNPVLKEGDLKNCSFSFKGFGGDVAGSLALAFKTKEARVDITAQNILLPQLLALKDSPLKKGTLFTKAALRTKANSIFDAVAGLAGTVSFQVKDGVVEAFDIKGLVADLKQTKDISGLSKLKDNFSKKADVSFQQVKGDFNCENGRATTDNAAFTSEDVSITAKGTVDLPKWNLDVKTTIRLNAFSELPSLGVLLTGPIDAPSYAVDQAQLAQLIVQGVASRVVKDVKKTIQNKIGDVVKGALGQASGDTASAQGRQSGSSQNDLGQAVGGLLGKLIK